MTDVIKGSSLVLLELFGRKDSTLLFRFYLDIVFCLNLVRFQRLGLTYHDDQFGNDLLLNAEFIGIKRDTHQTPLLIDAKKPS